MGTLMRKSYQSSTAKVGATSRSLGEEKSCHPRVFMGRGLASAGNKHFRSRDAAFSYYVKIGLTDVFHQAALFCTLPAKLFVPRLYPGNFSVVNGAEFS